MEGANASKNKTQTMEGAKTFFLKTYKKVAQEFVDRSKIVVSLQRNSRKDTP